MEPMSRRGFLVGACALAGVAGTALPAAAESAITRLPGGRVAVRLRAVPELAQVGGAVRIGTVKGQPAGLARTGPSSYAAFSLRCPHQGVTVVRDQAGWVCPAHGSQFEPDGELVLGPATTNLAPIPSRVNRGRVIVG